MVNLNFISRVCTLILFIFISFQSFGADLKEGETLFKGNCAACHNKNMKDKLTGPPLAGVSERWATYPKSDLYNWIRNSQKMISSGHPRATELWNAWKPTVMTNFTNLSDAQIDNILAYIDGVAKGEIGGAPKTTANTTNDDSKKDNSLLYAGIIVILGILTFILSRIISSLKDISYGKDGDEEDITKTLKEKLTSRSVVTFAIFALIVLGGYTTVNNAISLGRQQGFQPDQPIKFSHATHAGVNKIDCQYCHDGARRSKHSVIPATNTCMNCHAAIKKGSKYGTAEITKIYASIGFDPTTDKYIPDYDKLSTSEVAKIYKKWMADAYMAAKETTELDKSGESLVQEQWEGIVNSLTNENKPKVQGPIEWVRIHNLPDHVYYNHSQHVTVGKIECQTCHGPVEKMETLYQYAPLSMGWCVNCHRKTEVKGFADNDYYGATFKKYHDALKSGKKDKVTVEEIGGLECQKCHY
ncbi:MAG: c-type cytochrome [Saprospiraceae bacterium]|nr:c-type cytochrome [Saprospiraceae bacterium]